MGKKSDDLSPAMRKYLRQLYDAWLGPDSMVDPTMLALETRGLVEKKPPDTIEVSNGFKTRRVKHLEAFWVLTRQGFRVARKLIQAKRAARSPATPKTTTKVPSTTKTRRPKRKPRRYPPPLIPAYGYVAAQKRKGKRKHAR